MGEAGPASAEVIPLVERDNLAGTGERLGSKENDLLRSRGLSTKYKLWL